MKIEKTQGVISANHGVCIRIQEIILDCKEMWPIGKVVIDAEKMTFYKWGLKMGIARHSVNGIVYNNGNLSYANIIDTPVIRDKSLCIELFNVFNLNNPLGSENKQKVRH